MTTVDLTLEIIQQLRSLADSFELMLKITKKHSGGDGKTGNDAEANKTDGIKADDSVNEKSDIKESENNIMTSKNVNTIPTESINIKDSEKQPTLEELRAMLAEKSRDGHREAIKGILTKLGADKLTSLDPKHYAQILKEAGELK